MSRVKKLRRRGYTRISSKHQVTIPVGVLAQTGLRQGDELRVLAEGETVVLVPAQGLLERRRTAIGETAGALTGVYPSGYLDDLRHEWR